MSELLRCEASATTAAGQNTEQAEAAPPAPRALLDGPAPEHPTSSTAASPAPNYGDKDVPLNLGVWRHSPHSAKLEWTAGDLVLLGFRCCVPLAS